jgi:hypothetical protein
MDDIGRQPGGEDIWRCARGGVALVCENGCIPVSEVLAKLPVALLVADP